MRLLVLSLFVASCILLIVGCAVRAVEKDFAQEIRMICKRVENHTIEASGDGACVVCYDKNAERAVAACIVE